MDNWMLYDIKGKFDKSDTTGGDNDDLTVPDEQKALLKSTRCTIGPFELTQADDASPKKSFC